MTNRSFISFSSPFLSVPVHRFSSSKSSAHLATSRKDRFQSSVNSVVTQLHRKLHPLSFRNEGQRSNGHLCPIMTFSVFAQKFMYAGMGRPGTPPRGFKAPGR